MTVRERFDAAKFMEFIKPLIYGVDRMVFLIVDGHPTHKVKMVRRFLDSLKERFRLFCLPPYSPELYFDEQRFWNDLKNNTISKQVITTSKNSYSTVISYFRFIQKSPSRVRSYFNNETTLYVY